MFSFALAMATTDLWLTIPAGEGPAKGKHAVLLAGDEEYRSEEGLPQLARILARQGFKCTVLFSINDKGEIDPDTQTNQPGLEALKSADLCIMLLRFRRWPDAQMKHFVDYFESGKPIIALRTSTHAFNYPADSSSVYARYGWQSATWKGGFGKQVLGENWVSHWGNHGSQATRGVVTDTNHPVMKGVGTMFGPSDVYEVHLPSDAHVLARGEVVSGMKPEDAAAVGRKKSVFGVEQGLNDPMMPIAWTRSGLKNRILVTTMGAATDLLDENLRRMLVNGAFWAVGLEGRIDPKMDVSLTPGYKPSPFGFGTYRKGVKPSDLGG